MVWLCNNSRVKPLTYSASTAIRIWHPGYTTTKPSQGFSKHNYLFSKVRSTWINRISPTRKTSIVSLERNTDSRGSKTGWREVKLPTRTLRQLLTR